MSESPPLVGGGSKREATAALPPPVSSSSPSSPSSPALPPLVSSSSSSPASPPPVSSSSSSSPVLPKKRSSICLSKTVSTGASEPPASPCPEEAERVRKRVKLDNSTEPPNASMDAQARKRSRSVPCPSESSRNLAVADAQVSMDLDQIGPSPSDADAPNGTTPPSTSASSQCSEGSQGARRQSPVPMANLSASFGSISLAPREGIAMLADVAALSCARRRPSQKSVTKQPADAKHTFARNASAHERDESLSPTPSVKTPATASRSRDEDDDSCCGLGDPMPSKTTSVDEAAKVMCNMSKRRPQKNGSGPHGHRHDKVEHHRDRDQPRTVRRSRTSEVDHGYDLRDDVSPPPSSRRRRRRHYSHASGLHAADFALDDNRRDGGNRSRSNSLSGSDGEHDDRHHRRPHHSMSSSASWRSSLARTRSPHYSGGRYGADYSGGMHRDRAPDNGGGGALRRYSSPPRTRRGSYSAQNSRDEYHPAPRSDSHLPARIRKPSAHEQRLRAHAQAHAGKKRDRSAMELEQRHPLPKLPAVFGRHFFGVHAERDGGDDDELSPPPALRQKHHDITHANGHGTPEHPHGGAGGRTSYTSRSRQHSYGGSNPHSKRRRRSASISSNSSSGSVPSMMHPPAHARSSSAVLLTYERAEAMRKLASNHKPLTRSSARKPKRSINVTFNITIFCERDAEPVRLTARIGVDFFNARKTRHTASASSGDTPADAAVVGAAPAPAVAAKMTLSSSSNSMATVAEEDGTAPAAARDGEGSERQLQQPQPPQQQQPQQSGPSSEFATPRLPPLGRGRARRGPPVLADDLSDDEFGPGPRLRQRLFASPRQHVGSTHPPTNGDARHSMLGGNGNGRSSHRRSARGPSPTWGTTRPSPTSGTTRPSPTSGTTRPSPTSGTTRETSRPSRKTRGSAPSGNTRGSAPSRNTRGSAPSSGNTRGSAPSGNTRGSAPSSSMNNGMSGRDLHMNAHGLPQAHMPMLEYDDEMEPLGHHRNGGPGAGHQQHLQGGAGPSTGGCPDHKTTHNRIPCASCVRCWASKTKCSEGRPCKGCLDADVACEVRPCTTCIEQGTEHKCDSRKPCTPCRERGTKCGKRMVWSDKKRIPFMRRRYGLDGREIPPAVPISKRPLLPPSPPASPPPPLRPDMIAGGLPPSPSASPAPLLHSDMIAGGLPPSLSASPAPALHPDMVAGGLPPSPSVSPAPPLHPDVIAAGLPPSLSASASPPIPLHPDMAAEIERNSAAARGDGGGGGLSSPVEFNPADADEFKLPPHCVGHNKTGGGHSKNGGCNNNSSGGSANDAATEAGPPPLENPADETMSVSSVSIGGLPRAGPEPPLPTLPPAPVIAAAASAMADIAE